MGHVMGDQTKWPSQVPVALFRSRLPQPTAYLLGYLLTHRGKQAPTYHLIQKDTGMASKTVARALRNLQKLGVLKVTDDHSRCGENRGNSYVVHWSNVAELTPEFVEETLGKSARHTSHKNQKQVK